MARKEGELAGWERRGRRDRKRRRGRGALAIYIMPILLNLSTSFYMCS
jgi:hypothetical protein